METATITPSIAAEAGGYAAVLVIILIIAGLVAGVRALAARRPATPAVDDDGWDDVFAAFGLDGTARDQEAGR